MNLKSTYRLTLIMGFAQIYMWATTYYLPATLIKIVANEIGESTIALVGGFSWSLFLSGICAPKIGSWIENEGGRLSLFIGSLLASLGLIVLSATNGLIIWYIGWTIIGLAMALGLFSACFASLVRLFGQGAKKVIIRVTIISGFATFFWPLTTYLIQLIGWRNTLLAYSLPHLLIWAPIYYFSIPKGVPAEVAESTPVIKILGKMRIIIYLLASFAILRSVVGSTGSVFLINIFGGLGLSIEKAAFIAALIGPSQIAGRIIELLFGHKFNPINSGIFWASIMPISILLLLVIGAPASFIFAIAYGMSNGMATITMSILPLVLFGSRGYASLMGKLALPILVTQAISPVLATPIMDSWSTRNIFLLAGVLSFIALNCLIFLRHFQSHTKRVKDGVSGDS